MPISTQDFLIHRLDAPPEQKWFRADLGRMHLTRRVKMALFILQGCFGVMALLVGWRLIAGTCSARYGMAVRSPLGSEYDGFRRDVTAILSKP